MGGEGRGNKSFKRHDDSVAQIIVPDTDTKYPGVPYRGRGNRPAIAQQKRYKDGHRHVAGKKPATMYTPKIKSLNSSPLERICHTIY